MEAVWSKKEEQKRGAEKRSKKEEQERGTEKDGSCKRLKLHHG